jgi:hypothetical protein
VRIKKSLFILIGFSNYFMEVCKQLEGLGCNESTGLQKTKFQVFWMHTKNEKSDLKGGEIMILV